MEEHTMKNAALTAEYRYYGFVKFFDKAFFGIG